MIQERYYVKEITPDGLVKDPKNGWEDCVFNRFGYKSEEEAHKAVDDAEQGLEYFIFKTIAKKTDFQIKTEAKK